MPVHVNYNASQEYVLQCPYITLELFFAIVCPVCYRTSTEDYSQRQGAHRQTRQGRNFLFSWHNVRRAPKGLCYSRVKKISELYKHTKRVTIINSSDSS